MKKLSVFLTFAMLICLLAGCGSAAPSGVTDSSKPAEPSQSAAESPQTDVLYAVFSAEDVKEYPIEYTGAQKTAEELAHELTELTGLDFFITASKADDGWIVDWAADSTLVAGLDDREQKEEFFFFDQDSLRWFMMDSLWRTLTENLDAENIYYTMDGGQELVFEELYPVNDLPSDIPYMGSEFYFAHADVRGDEENPYARTMGLWRLDGATDTASIEMDGFGGFTMYYASGSVEAAGYLECTDEYENGDFRYDMYTAEGEWIVSFYFDSDTQLHIGNDDGTVYLLDTQADMQAAYQGFWEYPDGSILEINEEGWNLYEADELTPFAGGPVEYDEEAAYLMNADGSSGGGKVYFDEDGNLIDFGNVLTYLGDEGPTGDGEDSHNTYYDERTGLMLTYPNVFSSEGTLDENGKMNFYTLWDAGMLFWIESNESGWTPDAFMQTLDARECMELEGNVVIACGEGIDYSGSVVPMAWYYVVDPGFIANVEVQCTEPDEAYYWYEEFQRGAFWIENAWGIYAAS